MKTLILPFKILFFLCCAMISSAAFAQAELWGVTSRGGSADMGIIFTTNEDGTSPVIKYNFNAAETGMYPIGGLLSYNGKFYGATAAGGTSDAGTLFEFDPGTNSLVKKLDLASIGGIKPSGTPILAANGKIYGVCSGNPVGSSNYGILYEYDPATGAAVKKYQFTASTPTVSSRRPWGMLVQAANGKLYGISKDGGMYAQGAMFEFNPANNAFLQVINFGSSDPVIKQAMFPTQDIMLGSDGKIYGTTQNGPSTNEFSQGDGALYVYTPGGAKSNIVLFADVAKGKYPRAGVVETSDHTLYGTTSAGGTNGAGTLYEFDLNTSTYTKKIDFSAALHGSNPCKLSLSSNGKVYGITTVGGANNKGTLFEFDPASGSLTKVFDFGGSMGVPGTDNFLISSVNSRQNQTITFNTIPTKYMGDAAFALSAAASSGLEVIFTSSDPSVASIDGTVVTIYKEGTVTITANQVGSPAYYPAPAATQTLTVLRNNQTITFDAFTEKTFGDGVFQLSATTTAPNLTVTFTSADPSIASCSPAGNVVIHGAGTVVLKASQPGNNRYYAATPVERVLTIHKAQQSVQFGALSDKNINDASFTVNATSTSGGQFVYTSASDKISITGNTVSLVKPGRATITATQSGTSNYLAAAPVDQSFCITPARPEVSLSLNGSARPVLTSSAPAGNQWYMNGELIPGQSGQTIQLTETGIFKVKVKIDDCESQFSSEVAMVVSGNESAEARGIRLYPNPVTDWITVSLGDSRGKKSVTIYQLNGMSRFRSEYAGSEAKLNVSDYAAGTYFVKVVNQNSTTILKFVKQ
jgi:uncharacterized repeat protein (TIGR03803 family)